MLWLITVHPASALGCTLSLHFDPRISGIHALLSELFEAVSCTQKALLKTHTTTIGGAKLNKFPTQVASFKKANSTSNSHEKVPTGRRKKVTSESCRLPCLDLSIIVIVEETAASLFHRHSTVLSALMRLLQSLHSEPRTVSVGHRMAA